LGLTSTPFDLVVVDEAARCTASELSVPLQAGRWVILVGDQAQLEPLHKPEVVQQVGARTGFAKGEIIRSDFDRVFTTAYGAAAGKKLRTQYRMLPAIGRLVSDTFYPEIKLEHKNLSRLIRKVMGWWIRRMTVRSNSPFTTSSSHAGIS
jgi:superfamily I DNA and/or RNA helicase